jgi:hypothetical protein
VTWLKPTEDLLRYEVLGVTSPTNAHIIAKVCRTLYRRYGAETAVDLSPGERCFWSELVPVGLEVTFSPHDFTCTPYADRSFDVPFLDPPHLAGLGSGSYMRPRYGTYSSKQLPEIIRAGAQEAWRLARLGAVIKVCDHVNSAHFRRETGWVIDAIGQEPFDIVHVLHAPVGSQRWPGEFMSARNNGSTLLLFKRGSKYRRRAGEGA